MTYTTSIPFQQPQTGAVPTTVQSELQLQLNVFQFGAKGDGVTDDTLALQMAAAAGRVLKRKVYWPAAKYLMSGSVDPAGLQQEGDIQGYLNEGGTQIICANNSVIPFQQTLVDQAHATVFLKNFNISGAAVGVSCQYVLNSVIENVFVQNSLAGFIIGNTANPGPLFVTMRNCETNNITNSALAITGQAWANANLFEDCFFTGGTPSTITGTGGIGAIDNTFINCEFAGATSGINLGLTKNTLFKGCYFESAGPAIEWTGFSLNTTVEDCVFGSLVNDNPTGVNSFLYHNTTSPVKVSVRGGYIYLPAATENDNLTFISSTNPATLSLTMLEPPVKEIAATGFTMIDPLVLAQIQNHNLNLAGAFSPQWTAATTNPAIGNGTLTGDYVISGKQVTAHITMTAGSTTTFGTGAWAFSLPFPIVNTRAVGTMYANVGGNFYNIAAFSGNGSTISGYPNGLANNLSASVPAAWASTNHLDVSISYQCGNA